MSPSGGHADGRSKTASAPVLNHLGLPGGPFSLVEPDSAMLDEAGRTASLHEPNNELSEGQTPTTAPEEAQPDLVYEQWVNEGRPKCKTCRKRHQPPCRHTKRPPRKRRAAVDVGDEPAKRRATYRTEASPLDPADATLSAPPPGPSVQAPSGVPKVLTRYEQVANNPELLAAAMNSLSSFAEKQKLFLDLLRDGIAAFPAAPQAAQTYAPGVAQSYTYNAPVQPVTQAQPPLRGQINSRGRGGRWRGQSSSGGQNTSNRGGHAGQIQPRAERGQRFRRGSAKNRPGARAPESTPPGDRTQ